MVIDTSIFIEFLRAKNKSKTTLYKLPDHLQLYVTSVTLYELYMGATTEEKINDIKVLTEDIGVLSFNEEVAKKAAKLFHQLRKSNQIIEFRDIFIAATCLVNNQPIKTLNKKHFERIKGLTVE